MEIDARLNHLQLLSSDPARCAAFYGRTFGMDVRRQGDGYLCINEDRRLIVASGPDNRLGYAAYAFASEAGLQAQRRRIELHTATASAQSPLLEAGAFAVTDPDGNVIAFGVAKPEQAIADAGQAQLERSGDASAEPSPAPARLQHFAVRSRDPAKLLPFYCDVLGFVVSDRVFDGDDFLRACFLRTDVEHHALAIFHAPEQRHDHMSFETSDWTALRDWADRCGRVGEKIVWGVGRHGPGDDVFFMVRDPDGNLAEISCELEVCQPGRQAGRWPHEERTLNLWGSAILRS
ncbi:MAG: VOC family protein [Variovorax sp.]